MDSRHRLIESTQALLWDRGYTGVSPKVIQDLAGVGQGSMYHHFAGKSDLAHTALVQTANDLRAQAQRKLDGPGRVLERISCYLLQHDEVLRGCPLGRLVFDPGVSADACMRQTVKELFTWQHDALVILLKEGIAAGEFIDELNPEGAAITISAVLQGAYVLARASSEVEAFDRAINGLLTMLRTYTRVCT